MSEAISRFAALLQLADKMLARAERQDLEECIRLLAVDCVEYRSKFGAKIPVILGRRPYHGRPHRSPH